MSTAAGASAHGSEEGQESSTDNALTLQLAAFGIHILRNTERWQVELSVRLNALGTCSTRLVGPGDEPLFPLPERALLNLRFYPPGAPMPQQKVHLEVQHHAIAPEGCSEEESVQYDWKSTRELSDWTVHHVSQYLASDAGKLVRDEMNSDIDPDFDFSA